MKNISIALMLFSLFYHTGLKATDSDDENNGASLKKSAEAVPDAQADPQAVPPLADGIEPFKAHCGYIDGGIILSPRIDNPELTPRETNLTSETKQKIKATILMAMDLSETLKQQVSTAKSVENQ